MSRPCRCDRCRACRLWYTSARHRLAWGGPADPPPPPPGLPAAPPPAPPAAAPPPCAHLGDPLAGAERAAAGLSHARDWRRCGRGHALNNKGVPGVVCRCHGCGPRCPDYAAG